MIELYCKERHFEANLHGCRSIHTSKQRLTVSGLLSTGLSSAVIYFASGVATDFALVQ